MHCRNSSGLAEKLEALGSTDPWLVAKGWTVNLDLGDPCKFPAVGPEEVYSGEVRSQRWHFVERRVTMQGVIAQGVQNTAVCSAE